MPVTIRTRFIAFHKANPDIYDLFERFTLEAIDSGMPKVGSKFIFERIRWEILVGTKGAGYCVATKRLLKLNNNFTAWYARLFMAKNRMHIGVFELRVVKSK
jgi:hypothetical protein